VPIHPNIHEGPGYRTCSIFEHDHLPITDRGDIRARLDRQQGKGFTTR
jgi:hypothetical protein